MPTEHNALLQRIANSLQEIAEHLPRLHSQLEKSTPSLPAAALPKRKRVAKGVNIRLLHFLHRQPDAKDWSAERLAKALSCSKSAITGTATWKKCLRQPKTKTISKSDFDNTGFDNTHADNTDLDDADTDYADLDYADLDYADDNRRDRSRQHCSRQHSSRQHSSRQRPQ